MKQSNQSNVSFVWAIALCVLATLAGAAFGGPVNDAQPKIRMHLVSVGPRYLDGQAYLIPRSVDEVLSAIQSESKRFKGFERQMEDAHQTLSENEVNGTWTNVYYQYHPQAYQAAKQSVQKERLRQLGEMWAKQAITAAERSEWEAAILADSVTRTKIYNKALKIDVKNIRREEFVKRTSGKTVKLNEVSTGEFVVVLDVAPFLGHEGPLSLILHGGQKDISVRTQFKLASCMTGVTCIPIPHWETKQEKEESTSPEVHAALGDWAAKLGALPVEQVQRLSQAMNTEYEDGPRSPQLARQRQLEKDLPILSPQADVVDLTLHALSGTLDASEAYQPIKALADGRFFSTIGRDQHGGYAMRRDASGVQVQQLSSAVVAYTTRVDGNGQLWGLTVEPSRGGGQQIMKRYCLLKLDAQRWVMRGEDGCTRNRLFPSWLITQQGHAVLFAPASDENLTTRLVDLTSGSSPVPMESFFSLRGAARQFPLYSSIGIAGYANTLELGDGLFWFDRMGMVGVSPDTGKAQKSFRVFPSSDGTGKLVFGSSAGNWVLNATKTANGYKEVLRVHQLTDGAPLYDLPADYLKLAVARSAHGRLLAYAKGDNSRNESVVVWDMKTGTAVANIRKPEELDVLSVAFNWRGDELWIQARNRKTQSLGVMIWPVPDALRDPADLRNVPDQGILQKGGEIRR